jgi:hypothetical protein
VYGIPGQTVTQYIVSAGIAPDGTKYDTVYRASEGVGFGSFVYIVPTQGYSWDAWASVRLTDFRGVKRKLCWQTNSPGNQVLLYVGYTLDDTAPCSTATLQADNGGGIPDFPTLLVGSLLTFSVETATLLTTPAPGYPTTAGLVVAWKSG